MTKDEIYEAVRNLSTEQATTFIAAFFAIARKSMKPKTSALLILITLFIGVTYWVLKR
jgi:hypothetical protein